MTSSIVHNGTCCESLCGTSSPINLKVCAAYFDAIALGQLATFLRGSIAPISLNTLINE